MTLNELAAAATHEGLDLGNNPARTIRYYINKGLLEPPRIEYEGKVKRAIYSSYHLTVLHLICEYKKRGYRLEMIKDKIKEPLYWSEEALKFMRPFIAANNYPADAFSRDRPATMEETAVFLTHYLEVVKMSHQDTRLIETAFVDRKGQPAFRELEVLVKE